MQEHDVLIVGGGPAGSTCAWKLRQAGYDVAVLDKGAFPRTKLCAGWITQEVIDDLEFDVKAYPCSFLPLDAIDVHWRGLKVRRVSPQFSIRRYEFDDYLLSRSGAHVVKHDVDTIVRRENGYEIDGLFRCKYLIGAGGTRCPVYRHIFRPECPRATHLQLVAYEEEFPYEWSREECHLWFFKRGLPGYSWFVPKAGGHVNVGLGAVAETLKAKKSNVRIHWDHLTRDLDKAALVRGKQYAPRGYSYYLRGNVDRVRIDNAFIVGDSAGLATLDLCEGIGPAIQSGIMAANAIVMGEDYSANKIEKMTANGFVNRFLARQFGGRDALA